MAPNTSTNKSKAKYKRVVLTLKQKKLKSVTKWRTFRSEVNYLVYYYLCYVQVKRKTL